MKLKNQRSGYGCWNLVKLKIHDIKMYFYSIKVNVNSIKYIFIISLFFMIPKYVYSIKMNLYLIKYSIYYYIFFSWYQKKIQFNQGKFVFNKKYFNHILFPIQGRHISIIWIFHSNVCGEHIWSSICIYQCQNFAFSMLIERGCKRIMWSES